MTETELQSLLSPLAADAPCGANLQHDPAFLALEEAAAGKPEREYGTKLYPAEGPDWLTVHAAALALAARSRDLRIAVWLTRSGARLQGLHGAVRGLQLVHGLLQRHWEHVHPQIDEHDPTARMNALRPLVHASAGLADLRATRLTDQRGALTVRDIELALGRADPLPGELQPTEDGVLKGVAVALKAVPELAALMLDGNDAVQGIAKELAQRLEATQSPEFAPLADLMKHVADAARKAKGESDQRSGDHRSSVVTATAHAEGAIGSRDDAIRALGRVCEWIEHNEPASPAPLFIRRSQVLLTKNFIDIVRDLMPDGLKQIEHFAGKGNT